MNVRWIFLCLSFASLPGLAQDLTQSAPSPMYVPDYANQSQVSMNTPGGALVSEFDSNANPSPQPLVPITLTADRPPTQPGAERQGKKLVSGNFTVGSMFDDNVLSSPTARVSDQEYLLGSNVSLRQAWQRTRVELQSSPGFSLYQHASSLSTGNLAFSGALESSLVDQLTLRLRQDYARTNDLFNVVQNPLPFLGILNSTNQTIVTPELTRTLLTSNADLSYVVAEHHTLGLSGTFTKYEYSGLSDAALAALDVGVSGTQNTTLSLYYSEQLSERNSMNIHMTVMDLSLIGLSSHTRVYSLLGSQTLALSRHSTVMLYAGPEYSTSSGLQGNLAAGATGTSVASSGLGAAFGGIYSWTGQRTGLGVEVGHRATDGGGLTQAVTMTSGTIHLNRQFGSKWAILGDTTLANNQNLQPGSTANEQWRSLFASGTITRDLSRNFRASIRYDRIYQHVSSGVITAGNHNRVQFILVYFFKKPLGS